MANRCHVKKDDTVQVMTGKDAGRTGKVLKVFPRNSTAIVENIQFLKRHTRSNPGRGIKGGIVEREAPIHVSNLQVVCRECNRPTRVGYRREPDGKKLRLCKKCGGLLDRTA
jgi:large subunit ribosomal protein L24